MDITRTLEIARIEELKILSDVRLINKRDLNPVYSKDNLHVQFNVQGDVKGVINCYLCLDGLELSLSEKNYLFPLFVETMNILIGKQMTHSPELNPLLIKLSAPKLSMISKEINSTIKLGLHSYELEVEGQVYQVLAEYIIGAIN